MYSTGKFGSCSHNSFFPPSLSRAGLGGGNKGGDERGNERETSCGKAVVSCVCVGKDCDWVLYSTVYIRGGKFVRRKKGAGILPLMVPNFVKVLKV